MSNFFTLWRREVTACFLSPVAYVTIVLYLALSGFLFVVGLERNIGSAEPVESLLFVSLFFGLPVLATVISMRLFAEEKRTGTIETLMTAPVTETEVVMGKYAGALTFMLVAGLPAVSSVFVVAGLNQGIRTVDVGALAGGCLVYFLLSAFCVAVGLLVSLMTRNQIIAAICCFCAIVLPVFLRLILSMFPFGMHKAAEYVSVEAHILDFSRGSIDTRPLILYLSCTVFLLFAAVRMLESRKWR